MSAFKNMRLAGLVTLVWLAIFAGACVQSERRAAGDADRSLSNRNAASQNASREPTMTVAPVEQGEAGYKIATADTVTFTVRAPGAREVKLLYQPVIADDRFIELKTLGEPIDKSSGEFQARLQIPPDFTGDVWARVSYPDSGAKQTERLALTTRAALGDTDTSSEAATSKNAGHAGNPAQSTAHNRSAANGGSSIGKDESVRSDKATGGRIERTSLREGQGNVHITVNVPAFLLTLWQNGKEVATYPVGVGLKNFPVPISEREASQIILNPAWIPPDSSWVSENLVGERIEADDPRNPLGKIKIPLGQAYLIHEAAEPSDIGNLVSHGCIRMLTNDIFDLTKKIARAQGLPTTTQEIEQARSNTERRSVKLDAPLVVDINYDTHVVEGGRLRLYPDVYERNANTVEKLREELKSIGVDESKLDEEMLRTMLERVSTEQQFVVKVSDIKAGQALVRGRTEPLTEQQAKQEDTKRDGARAQQFFSTKRRVA